MKIIDQRIAYYTRKVAERVSHHPAKVLPAKYTYRNYRLMLYKRLMHQQIKAAGY
ncbi:hypothetical protein LC048_13770 [Mesobacillus subterraneus]|uniref:hypothetical protein n=1 Tax=Mesobacillus subterraneus TaxID=285983 RepID=UPI001CFEE293|nr:hypothetical protein [Mesobacillus subterraneus]WLR53591.1 hypothetical protein LC048_13770 [Mesobacillus subterraneus]